VVADDRLASTVDTGQQSSANYRPYRPRDSKSRYLQVLWVANTTKVIDRHRKYRPSIDRARIHRFAGPLQPVESPRSMRSMILELHRAFGIPFTLIHIDLRRGAKSLLIRELRVPNERGGGTSNERTDNSGNRDHRDRCRGLLSPLQT
jgi:hypothetical protein